MLTLAQNLPCKVQGALCTRLPPLLAHETTMSGVLQDGEERGSTNDSPGIAAPEERLTMRPDIMMVGLKIDDLHDKANKIRRNRRASKEENVLLFP